MRIAELTAFHVHVRLRKTIRHASHTRRATDSMVVCCRLTDGTEGWGEGLPRKYVTGETIETAWEQFQQTNLREQLGGDFDGLDDVLRRCDDFVLERAGHHGRDCFGNALRCAIELSVLDAAARVEGVPLSQITHRVPETAAIRQSVPEVRYSGAITSTQPAKTVIWALQFRMFGFHQVKVKVGVNGTDDAAALRRIRRVLGRRFDVRIDANEAWTCDNLQSKLELLEPFTLTAVEQPVPHEQVSGLANVRPHIATPIMLDESLCSRSDAARAIEYGTCDLFNIRLSKCGGFLNSLRLAAMAHKAGLGYQLGCQVGETGILSAAGRHFATSVAGIRYLEGSYDRVLVHERLTQQDLTFGFGGRAPALNQPGLGVDIDRRAVQRITVKESHIRFS